ncbi:hypothetical protein EGJ09_04480 [Pseudomonas sp. p106]|nr:hypothetical protein EGJ09_04480 [Pseudomonas sp. p106]
MHLLMKPQPSHLSAIMQLQIRHAPRRSGLVSRKGRKAAPAFQAAELETWGRFAALSRHKAAPTKGRRMLPWQAPIKKPATRAGFFTAIRITPDEPAQPAYPSGLFRQRRKQSGLLSGS